MNELTKYDFCIAGKAASIISFEEVYMRIFRVFNGLVGCYLIGRVSDINLRVVLKILSIHTIYFMRVFLNFSE